MSKIKTSRVFKTICFVLIICFISLDISWAYPAEQKPQTSTLAIPNTMWRAQFDKSVFSDIGVATTICNIGKELFDDDGKAGLPVRFTDSVFTAELRTKLGNATEGFDLSHLKFENGVAEVPYKDKEDREFIIKIAQAANLKESELAGYDYVLDKYAVKYLPTTAGISSKNTIESPKAAVEAKIETPKVEESKACISEPIAELAQESTGARKGAFAGKRTIIVRAILRSVKTVVFGLIATGISFIPFLASCHQPGGDILEPTPTPAPTPTFGPTPTGTPALTPTPTPIPGQTPTPIVTPTPGPTPTSTPTPTPTATPTPTITPTPTPTPVPVPTQPSIISVQSGDRRLFVRDRNSNGTLGNVYSFVSKGTDFSQLRGEFIKWYQTDIPMMAAMGVNTVRVYADFGTGADAIKILDMFYRNGIKVIMAVDINNIQAIVNAYKNHPAILMWAIGNEWDITNYNGRFSNLIAAAQFTEQTAQLIKSLDSNHPIAAVCGDLHEPNIHPLSPEAFPFMSGPYTSEIVNQYVPSVDVWVFNLYRGSSFTDALRQWASISTKPMLIGEFGADSYDHRTGSENQSMQSEMDAGLWDEAFFDLSAERTNGVCIGVLGFEWNDEWWKSGNSSSHDISSETSYGQPDLHNDEEWFGILDIDRKPKTAYSAMQSRYKNGQSAVMLDASPTIRVTSKGTDASNGSKFEINDKTVFLRGGGMYGGRGINVMVLDRYTGIRAEEIKSFDTWRDSNYGTNTYAAHRDLVSYLNSLPNGSVIAISIGDEGGISNHSHPDVQAVCQAIQSLGSAKINNVGYWDSWAMVAVKGQGVLAEDYKAWISANESNGISIEAKPSLTLDPNQGRRASAEDVSKNISKAFETLNQRRLAAISEGLTLPKMNSLARKFVALKGLKIGTLTSLLIALLIPTDLFGATGKVGIVSSVFLNLKDFVFAYPIIAGITAISIGIIAFFTIWRMCFPVSWYLWRLRNNDYGAYEAAVRALVKIGSPAVSFLIKALDDNDSNVRSKAVYVLGEIKDLRAVEPLIKILHDSNSHVREYTRDALIKIGSPAVPFLIKALDNANSDIRSGVAKTLGRIKDPIAVEPLIRILDDTNSDVRYLAAKALGEIKDPRAVEPLIKALGNNDRLVRCFAAEVLGEIKDPRAVEPLIKALDDKDSNVRSRAVYVLGEIKDPRAVEPLIKALDDKDSNVRSKAVYVLGKIKDLRAVEPLIKVLDDNDFDVRSRAVYVLGEIKDLRAVEPLIRILDDTNSDVRYPAAKALGEIKDLRAVEPLIKILHDSNSHVREYTRDALIKIGSPAVVFLVSLLADNNFDVRSAAAGALVAIKDSRLFSVTNYLQTMSGHNPKCYVVLTADEITHIVNCLRSGINIEASSIPYSAHDEEYRNEYYVSEGTDAYGNTSGGYTRYEKTHRTVIDSQAKLIIKNGRIQEITQKTPVKKNVLMPQYVPDVPFWQMEVPAFDASKEDMSPWNIDSILEFLNNRNWMWHSLKSPEFETMRSKAIEKIKIIQSKIPIIMSTLNENGLISNKAPLVGIYLMGSYPWVESPNDIDLVVVTSGEKDWVRISSTALSVKSKEIIPNLETSFEIVGLETLKRAARGEEFDKAKIVRRKLITYSGAVPLLGVDIFKASTPPLESYDVMRKDLLIEANLTPWENIKGDVEKIEAKKKWRQVEATALKVWIESQGVRNIMVTITQELSRKQEASLEDLFTLVQSKFPASMESLTGALKELEPLSKQVNLSADAISKAINQAKEKYSLSDDQTKILWLALTGPGQGKGEYTDNKAESDNSVSSGQISARFASSTFDEQRIRVSWLWKVYREGILDILENKEPGAPFQIEIHPYHYSQSLPCNNFCDWCTRKSDKLQLRKSHETGIKPNRLIKFIKSLRETGVKLIVISGNSTEPLLYPWIGAMLKSIKSSGLNFRLYTNFYHGERVVDIATSAATNGDWIRISLDAGNKDSYYKTHHPVDKEAFDKIIKNIEELLHLRGIRNSPLQVQITYLMTEDNSSEEELSSIIKWADRVGVDMIRFSVPLKPTHQNLRFNLAEDVADVIKARVTAIASGYKDHRINIQIRQDVVNQPEKTFSRCYHGQLIPVIGARGRLYPCTSTSIADFHHLGLGDINRGNFDFWKIWRDTSKWHHDVKPCPDCTRFEYDLNETIEKLSQLTARVVDRREKARLIDKYFESVEKRPAEAAGVSPEEIRTQRARKIYDAAIASLNTSAEKSTSMSVLFAEVWTRTPNTATELSGALNELKDLAYREGLTQDDIVDGVNRVGGKYSLTPEEVMLVRLALLGQGQGMGEVEKDVRKHTRGPRVQATGEGKTALRDVRFTANNRRANITEGGNTLINRLGEIGYGRRMGDVRFSKKQTAMEMRLKAQKILNIWESLRKNSLPEDVNSIAKYIRKEFKQLEADSIVSSIIILARKAKREGQQFILGIDTDWIPGYDDNKSLQHQAMDPIMNEIIALPEILRDLGMDNVKVIFSKGGELEAGLLKSSQDSNTDLSNMVVLASTKNIDQHQFDSLMTTNDTKKAFIAGIDPTEIRKLYEQNRGGTIIANIKIVEILALVLELASNEDKEPPRNPLVIGYDKAHRILLLLPRALPIKYETLRDNNFAQAKALQAA